MSDELSELVAKIADKCRIFEPTNVETDDWAQVLELDACTVFRALEEPIRLILVDSSAAQWDIARGDNWFNRLLLANLQLAPAIVLVLSVPSTAARRAIAQSNLGAGCPICTADDLLSTQDIKDFLRRVILPCASAVNLIPYKIHMHARRNMFFNRQHELQKLHNHRGHSAIVGARRIGKTSLALRFKSSQDDIDRSLGSLDLDGFKIGRCAYLDLGQSGSAISETIWGQILRAMGLEPRRYKTFANKQRMAGANKIEYELDEARAAEQILGRLRQNLVIILDEIDGWISSRPRGKWRDMDRLRAMTERSGVRLILVGYELLEMALGNDAFPFYGRVQTIHLRRFDHDSVNSLVIDPISELGIEMEPRGQILDRIWHETLGDPHLVQEICGHLVNRCIRERIQKVSMADLGEAIGLSQQVKLDRKAMRHPDFPLAEAIAGLTILGSGSRNSDEDSKVEKSISRNEILRKLMDGGFSPDDWELEMALTYLDLRSIIRPLDEGRMNWTWVSRVQRDNMSAHIGDRGVRGWLDDLIAQHQTGNWKRRYENVLGDSSESQNLRT